MALHKTTKTLPKGAIEVSDQQAFEYQMEKVMKWEPKKDVWPLIFGPGILGGMAAVTGVYFNNYIRKKLNLGNFGRISTYLPIVTLPSIGIVLMHYPFIMKPLVLEEKKWKTQALKAASFQAGLGVLYPMALAPLPAFMFATRHMTFYVPPISQPIKLFSFVKDLNKPIFPKMIYLAMGQMIIAAFIIYLENNSVEKLNKKLVNYEEELID